jgi:hypothetical protein
MLRSMTRMIVGSIVLALSAWVGFRVWQIAPTLSLEWTGKSLTWITTGLPIAAFLFAFLMIRKIARTLARPFGTTPAEENPRSFAWQACRILFAIIPTALIGLIVIALIHHGGTMAEIRAFSDKAIGSNDRAPASAIEQLKWSVESAIPADWLKFLDPFTEPSRLTLAKLITAQSDSPLKPVINPQTGQPIPRAIIVDNPELQNLARDGNFSTLLHHPLLTKALADPKVQQLLHDLKL